MPAYIALLRAVNVAGHQPVAMSALREVVESCGFSDVRTLLQSGNVVFGAKKQKTDAIEKLLQSRTAKALGVDTDFLVRTSDEWKTIVEGNPFAEEAQRDPGRLVLLLLKNAADTVHIKALQQAITGREVVKGNDRTLYAVYPDGQGRSRLTTALIERKLGTVATARNWNTVLKLLGAATMVR